MFRKRELESRRKRACPLTLVILGCFVEAAGIAVLVHRKAFFVDGTGGQVADAVADGASGGAEGITKLVHEIAAPAAVGFTRKLACDLSPGTG